MDISLTTYEYYECKLSRSLGSTLSNFGSPLKNFDYGQGLRYIGIVLCCDPYQSLKRRKRLSSKDKSLRFDIIFDYPRLPENEIERRFYILDQICNGTTEVVMSYKIKEFASLKFVSDWKAVIDSYKLSVY